MSADDEDDKTDLTRIEDLSEYLHAPDEEADRLLDKESSPEEEDSSQEPQELSGEEEEGGEVLEEDSWEGEELQASEEEGGDLAGELEEPPEEEKEEELPFQEDSWEEEESPRSEEESLGPEEELLAEEEEEEEGPLETSLEEPLPSPSPPQEERVLPQDAPSQENFQDLRDFGQAVNFGAAPAGGNPSFGLILKGVRYREEVDAILALLRELRLCHEGNEKILTESLENGQLFISQISEYSAIFLAHRLRSFDVDIQVGFVDELRPSKIYGSQDRGLLSKGSFKHRVDENVDFSEEPLRVEKVLMATTPTLESYTISRYIQVVSGHMLVDEKVFKDLQGEDEASRFSEIYQQLASELQSKAQKLKANAVVGLNYQITPLISREGHSLYKVTCTGNAVWVVGEEKASPVL